MWDGARSTTLSWVTQTPTSPFCSPNATVAGAAQARRCTSSTASCRGHAPPHRAQDFVHRELISASFNEVLSRLGSDVFNHKTQRGRYIFYNVGPLAEFGKLDVIALGSTQTNAEQGLLADLPRQLGL